MGFLVTTLIFIVVGVIASLLTRICCNRGPSANLYVDILSLLFFLTLILLKLCMCECVRGYFLNHLVSEVLWLPWFFFQFLFVAFNLSYELSRLFGCSRTTCVACILKSSGRKKHTESSLYINRKLCLYVMFSVLSLSKSNLYHLCCLIILIA